MTINNKDIKQRLGFESAKLIKDGMLVGLGTGTTAFYFIQSLIERCKQGLKIKGVASSKKSEDQARQGGIPILDPKEIDHLDIYVDGADEVDPKNRLIKGRGGALVREKILSTASGKMIVIVDESKLVSTLGQALLPIEILPFAYKATIKHIENAGYKGMIRGDHAYYVTDNGNYIFDIKAQNGFKNPEEDHKKLIQIPGVVDTGFFFPLACEVLIGYASNKLEWRHG